MQLRYPCSQQPRESCGKPVQLGFHRCIAASTPTNASIDNSTPYQRGFAAMLQVPGISGFRVESLWFGVLGLKLGVWGLGYRV